VWGQEGAPINWKWESTVDGGMGCVGRQVLAVWMDAEGAWVLGWPAAVREHCGWGVQALERTAGIKATHRSLLLCPVPPCSLTCPGHSAHARGPASSFMHFSWAMLWRWPPCWAGGPPPPTAQPRCSCRLRWASRGAGQCEWGRG